MSTTIDKIVSIASAVIKNKEGKVLLLQRSGIASYPDHWQLVEGKLEESERVDSALKREVQEEIGGIVKVMHIDTVFYNELPAKGQYYLAFRVVFDVELESDEVKISEEHKSFAWYTKDEALSLQLLPGVKAVLQKLA
jgi:mutator protein MutT